MVTAFARPLRAVIYVRISKEEAFAGTGVESTQLQERDARAAIEANGWKLVARAFVDHGVSGAEFQKRAKFNELLAAAARGEFDVVVVRDQKRIGRDAARVTHALVELDNCGVRAWSYLDKKVIEIGGAEFIVTAANGYAAENERKGNNANIRRALRARAESGMSTGCRRFGYRSVPIEGATPNRNGNLPRRWEIDPKQAAIVVRVAETFAAAKTYRGAALLLVAAGVPSPTGGPWDFRMVRAIAKRPLYRGVHRHGATRTVEQKGTRISMAAPDDEVLRAERANLRILTPELIARVDATIKGIRAKGTHAAAATIGGRSRHMGAGILACSACGCGLVVSGSAGNRSYTCNKRLQVGAHACPGCGYRSQSQVEAALARMAMSLVTGRIAEKAVAKIRSRMKALSSGDGRQAERARLERALGESERRQRNLARALAAEDGDQTDLLEERRSERARADALRAQLAAVDAAPTALDSRRKVAAIEAKLGELAANLDPKAVLATALAGRRIMATPVIVEGRKRWSLRAEVQEGYLWGLVGADVPAPSSEPPASASSPSCGALPVWTCALRRRRPAAPSSAECASCEARGRSPQAPRACCGKRAKRSFDKRRRAAGWSPAPDWLVRSCRATRRWPCRFSPGRRRGSGERRRALAV